MRTVVLCKAMCHIRGIRVNALLRPFNQTFANFNKNKETLHVESSDLNLPLPAMVKKLSLCSGQARIDVLDSLLSRAYGDKFDLFVSLSSKNYKDKNLMDFTKLMRTFGSKELGLFPILVTIVSSDNEMARTKSLEIMSLATVGSESYSYMLSQELGLVPVLASVLSSTNSGICSGYNFALVTLSNILTDYQQRNFSPYSIGSKDFGILPPLLKILDYGKPYSARCVLCIVEAVAREPESRAYMGSEELGLIHYLSEILLSSDDDQCLIAINILDCLSEERKNIFNMCFKELRLVPTLKKLSLRLIRYYLKIQRIIGRLEIGAPPMEPYTETDPNPPTEPTTTTTATYYAEIWALISDPSKAVDPERLTSFLSELGLNRADELGCCDGAMWEDLAAHLKPIPKRGLLRILGKNKITVGK